MGHPVVVAAVVHLRMILRAVIHHRLLNHWLWFINNINNWSRLRFINNRLRLSEHSAAARQILQVLTQRFSQSHDALVVINHRLVRDIQSRPLRPIKGVIHERLALIPTQHRQVIDVMGDRHTFNIQKAMGAAMHPAPVMGFHLQGVDERLLQAALLDVIGKSFVTKLTNHRHHVGL